MMPGCTVLLNARGEPDFRIHSAPTVAGRRPIVQAATDAASGVTAVIIGALMYREDIGVPLPPRDASNGDAAIALAVYRQGGVKKLERLEGEFALILWDGIHKRLIALRDAAGSWPIFWLEQGSTIAISTSLEALVRLQPGRTFDQRYLAEFLMWPNPHTELPCERTAFIGVQRLRAGSIIDIGPDRRVVQRRYWVWDEQIEQAPNGMTREEAASRVAFLFREAVRQRLQSGPAAAHLSGGMDSSAVACVAQEEMDRAGHSPLATLSLVYNRPSLAGEREYIDLVLKERSALKAHFVNGEISADYDWFQAGVPFHEEPYAGLPGVGIHRLLIDAANALGCTTVLSGEGSDEILASSPVAIADRLQQGRWLSALWESRGWARALNWGLWTTLYRFGLEMVWPRTFGGRVSQQRLGWFSVPPWIKPDFARTHQMKDVGHEHARRLSGKPLSRAYRDNMLDTGSGDWARWYLASPLGMTYSHPFQDPRLSCMVLGLPQSIVSDPAERKPVLQSAMRGILPEAIRTRREKRGFDDIYGMGLARNLPFLERMVQASPLSEMGILQVDPLVRAMRDASLGIGDIRTRERMDKTLALIAWFDQYSPEARHSFSAMRNIEGREAAQRSLKYTC